MPRYLVVEADSPIQDNPYFTCGEFHLKSIHYEDHEKPLGQARPFYKTYPDLTEYECVPVDKANEKSYTEISKDISHVAIHCWDYEWYTVYPCTSLEEAKEMGPFLGYATQGGSVGVMALTDSPSLDMLMLSDEPES